MWKCPICNTTNENSFICLKCGFDDTQNYMKYKSVIKLPSRVKMNYLDRVKGSQKLNVMLDSTISQFQWDSLSVSQMMSKIIELLEQKESSQKQIQELEKKNNNLSSNLVSLRITLEACQKENAVLKSRLKQAEKQVQELQTQFDNCSNKSQNGKASSGQIDGQKLEEEKLFLSNVQDGDANVQCKRGNDYYYGNNGFGVDYEEAIKWYQKAAAQNHTEAEVQLGECYYYGRGVKKNYQEAVKWFKRAAEKGNNVAQYYLGQCYYYSYGVKGNNWLAEEWFRKAAKQGHHGAELWLRQNGKLW